LIILQLPYNSPYNPAPAPHKSQADRPPQYLVKLAADGKFPRLFHNDTSAYSADIMKKTNNAHGCFFRRWVNNLLVGLLKHQSHSKKVLDKLQDIEESIQNMAREIARQVKRGK